MQIQPHQTVSHAFGEGEKSDDVGLDAVTICQHRRALPQINPWTGDDERTPTKSRRTKKSRWLNGPDK